MYRIIVRGRNKSFARRLSSALTAEELKVGAEKVHRHSKYLQSTSAPKSLTGGGMGSGVELHSPKDMTEIAVLTGMPFEQKQRTVVIAPRELKTMQSGDGNSYQWTITWKNRQRWSNPLMGWTSTADPMSNVKLTFDSKEDAEAYAAKNGWKTEVRGGTAKVRPFFNRLQRVTYVSSLTHVFSLISLLPNATRRQTKTFLWAPTTTRTTFCPSGHWQKSKISVTRVRLF